MVDFTTLSVAELCEQMQTLAREAQTVFGALNEEQLNWKPAPVQWSVAQCFAHLVHANQLMLREIDRAENPAHRPSLWQRMPMLPGLLGPVLIRSQAPTNTRKYKAPPIARPATSNIPADIIDQFVQQQTQSASRLQTVDAQRASRAIMSSPFLAAMIYSVLDGWRVMVAHDWRHLEQARRVMTQPAFPRGSGRAI